LHNLTSKDAKDLAFEDIFSDVEWNEQLKMEIIKELSSMKLGDLICFSIYNESSKIILFPDDLGVASYEYNPRQQEWVLLPNKLRYIGNLNPYIYPNSMTNFKENRNSDAYIEIKPDINGEEARTIRVIVIGNVVKNGAPTDRKVGAYLDVTLEP
jgi:hypothetical protein